MARGNISHPEDLFIGVYYGGSLAKLTPIFAFAYIIITAVLTSSIGAHYTLQVWMVQALKQICKHQYAGQNYSDMQPPVTYQ